MCALTDDKPAVVMGDLVGTGKIVGDIVGHVLDVKDMEAYPD
jgi:hypothetical protein